jgi:hypothetical protein
MPASGGSYRYLREMYGPQKWGRLISFLFIWQVSFSAPLSIATGCIGLAGYAAYYWPDLETVYLAHHDAALHIPWVGSVQVSWIVTPGTGSPCHLFLHRTPALPADHGDRTAVENLVVWGDGNDRLDHLAGLTHFQFRAGIRFPARSVHPVAPILHRPGWSDAGCDLRLLGLLQRLLSGRRD